MADKIVVMSGGEVQQVGSPMELYENPANRFVAGFIGNPAMNFWREGDHEIGLRPEDLHLASEGLKGRIRLVERLGATTLLHVQTDKGLICVQAPGKAAATLGAEVAIAWDASRAYRFDTAGRRL